MRCKETSGILFSHPCDQLSTIRCGVCDKPICDRHARRHAGKSSCIQCVRRHLEEGRGEGGTGRGGYEKDPYFFYYYGTYWGDAYSDADFALFDGSEAAADYGAEDDGAWVGS